MEAAANFTLDRSPNLGKKSLGIDYGTIRTGVAVSVGFSPRPLAILPRDGLIDKITNYARSHQVEQIILGWPIFQNGTIAPQAELTLEFGKTLQTSIYKTLGNVPVLLCDERYTSQAADARRQTGSKGFAQSLDAESACILLEAYFNDGHVHPIELEGSQREDCLREFQQKLQRQQLKPSSIQTSRPSREERIKAAALVEEESTEASSTKKKKKKRRKKR